VQIIHLTFDHPDLIMPNKTKAVKNLYSSQRELEHVVFSLNRSSGLFRSYRPVAEEHGYTLRVFGLPFGIMLRFWMYLSYRRIRALIRQNDFQPALIHAHKLTFEGIIASHLARSLRVPYILTIRGDSDLKVIKYKRLYRSLYKRIIERAQSIIFLAPWTVGYIERYFPKELFQGKYTVVPNIVALGTGARGEKRSNGRFITVFHFINLKRKNIKRVIQAFDRILSEYPSLGLDIAGSGPNEDKLRSIIRKSRYASSYSLLGKIENRQLIHMMAAYLGFVLPSYPETFGIVFIEALSAGIPIIYSENSGIDGYFESFQIGEKIDHSSIDQICSAIRKLIMDNDHYRQDIERLRDSGALKEFSSSRVGSIYSGIIEKAVRS
jgi:glycosyltransferase involved in cell wall biosynthesis